MEKHAAFGGEFTAARPVCTFPLPKPKLPPRSFSHPVSGPDQIQGNHWQDLFSSVENLEAFAFFFEVLPTPILLLTGHGRLVSTNREGERLLNRKDAILIDRSGVVRMQNRKAQIEFRNLLAHYSSGDANTNGDVQTLLAIPRLDGWPLAAMLVGAHRESKYLSRPISGEHARCILALRDPDRSPSDVHDWLTQLYGLSQAEAIVVGRLASGAALQEIASDRGVSVVTVRNQLKSALAKIGVSRQAELVSLVLRTRPF